MRIRDIDDIEAALEQLFDLSEAPEYEYDHPPGTAEPIGGPLPVEMRDYDAEW